MKVLLVDDHLLYRVGVRRFLAGAPECEIIGEAGTAAEAFALVERVVPDVVLMDIELPGTDGIRATREILRRAPAVRVLILSGYEQISDVVAAFAAGASGYALKDEGANALTDALRVIGRGGRYVAPSIESRLAKFEERQRRPDNVLEILSTREREVFRLAAECTVSCDIGVALGIARKTVETHLYRINQKLGLRNLAELVRLAVSAGVIQSPRPRAVSPPSNGAAQPRS